MSPPTPDYSPPSKKDPPLPQPAMEQREKPQFLQPLIAESASQHLFRPKAGSRAESFRTAREGLASGNSTPVHLPDDDRLPEHWLDSTSALKNADLALGDTNVEETPRIEETRSGSITPKRRSRHESPPSAARHENDWEKHISYVSGPGELDDYIPPGVLPPSETSNGEMTEVKGLGVSGAGLQAEKEPSVEDLNNIVYKRIQEENAKRHSTISTASGAIPVGIVMVSRDITPRTLKRRTKCFSLRGDTSDDSKRDSGSSIEREQSLKYKKRNITIDGAKLGQSPVIESTARQVSSPAHLGAGASNMNAMAVKRSNADAMKPESHSRSVSNPEPQPRKPSNPVRGVIPSIASTTPSELSPTRSVRRFSREERLENNENVRRTSLDMAAQSPRQTDSAPRRPSLDKTAVPSSPRKSLDARHLYPMTTPMSMRSQFSDQTNAEVLEASGVRLYPHNNESLLVVQNGSRPASQDNDLPELPNYRGLNQMKLPGLPSKPVFAAEIEPPTPTLAASRPVDQIDSPLTNPRAAPEPPAIKFIPPTPNQELEKQLEETPQPNVNEANRPQRKLSLVQRARRYSDLVFPRIGSLRSSRSSRYTPQDRPSNLSPLWRPQGFWDDFDSEEEDFDDFEPHGTLPAGGDTSSVGSDDAAKKRLFPRAMSKRLPGFRGTGGFLVGNSLGIDRHGTNNRRHYVSTTTKTLSKRQSQELMKSISSNHAAPNGAYASRDSLQRIARARTFVVPFSGGRRAQWVGTKRFRAKVKTMRLAREDRQREKMKASIRMYPNEP